MALAAFVLALMPATIRAEVTRVEISSREDVLGGKAFGTVGAYEKLHGKVYFALDPGNEHNQIIADLDKAPKNSQGRVEFSSDLLILKPKEPSKGNGVAFFDKVNRGSMLILGAFNRAQGSTDPTDEAHFGDGLLMREGYTVVAVGWEFDVRKDQDPQLIGIDVPIATENGQPITGWVNQEIVVGESTDSLLYNRDTWKYPPLDPEDSSYRLTESGFAVPGPIVAAPRLIPREDWQFGRVENGKIVLDTNYLWMKDGFKAGYTYEVTYQTKNSPVAGLGFAAIRDLASEMKNNPDAIVRAQYVYTYGASQTGRSQRQLVYEGFTTDEEGRRAIDALFINTGGSSFGSFNERFAVPWELGAYYHTKFPIRYEMTTDPVTGKRDGLGARVPAGLEPKIFHVDTGSEQWGQGRVATLLHTSIDGREDLPDPPNVRIYYLAGSKHGAGSWPPAESDTQQELVNPLDYRYASRGLLAALDRWVREGVEPPASRHPRWSDGTMVAVRNLEYPDIPGVQWPGADIPGSYRVDVSGPATILPFLVSQVDGDGNEIGGIRLPEQVVPLGTYRGWEFRSESAGLPTSLVPYAGGYIPFARTRVERLQNGDPRPSVEERYASRADYMARVEEVANGLAQERYMLQEDVGAVVGAAGEHWDWTMSARLSRDTD
jgi:hypothetical protein